jgi:hypothetical protein
VPELDLTADPPVAATAPPPVRTEPFNPDPIREETRGDLARGLLWLLTFAIGGVLFFVGVGRLEGTVITQSIFPSLIALAGTALGFYFGSQTGKPSYSGNPPLPAPGPNQAAAQPAPAPPPPAEAAVAQPAAAPPPPAQAAAAQPAAPPPPAQAAVAQPAAAPPPPAQAAAAPSDPGQATPK